jgi:methyltransferase-like protein
MKTFSEFVNESNENLTEAKIKIEDVYSHVEDKGMGADIDGVNFRDIKKKKQLASVPEGTMFYAVNKAGKKQAVRQPNNVNADVVNIDGKDYFVLFNMSFPGKKGASEPMFALV